jgi:hypothetical protein
MQVVNLPNPHEVVDAIMPLVGVVAVMLVSGLVVLGPVGRAIGRAIMYRLGGEGAKEPALRAGELREMRGLLEDQGGRLESVQRQVAELAERQDFTERLLAQVRAQGRLPGAGQGAG